MQFFLRLAYGSASLLDIFACCVQACLQLGRDGVGSATLCALLCIQCNKTLCQSPLHRLCLALYQCPNSIHCVGCGRLHRYFLCWHKSLLSFRGLCISLAKVQQLCHICKPLDKNLRILALILYFLCGNSNTSKIRRAFPVCPFSNGFRAYR